MTENPNYCRRCRGLMAKTTPLTEQEFEDLSKCRCITTNHFIRKQYSQEEYNN